MRTASVAASTGASTGDAAPSTAASSTSSPAERVVIPVVPVALPSADAGPNCPSASSTSEAKSSPPPGASPVGEAPAPAARPMPGC
jgi:hypothetical protein